MPHVVESVEQARRVVEYFNAFHDGFIARLTLNSHDFFEDWGVHAVMGPFDLEIVFAHYNYLHGVPSHEQRVEARFTGVGDVRVAFTGRPEDWPITSLTLEAGTGGVEAGARLRARLVQPRLVDGVRWEHSEALSFTFLRAEFHEDPAH